MNLYKKARPEYLEKVSKWIKPTKPSIFTNSSWSNHIDSVGTVSIPKNSVAFAMIYLDRVNDHSKVWNQDETIWVKFIWVENPKIPRIQPIYNETIISCKKSFPVGSNLYQ